MQERIKMRVREEVEKRGEENREGAKKEEGHVFLPSDRSVNQG